MRWGLGVALLSVGLVLVLPASALAFGPLSSFGSYGDGAGQFEPGGGIAIGPSGDTYVADSLNGRVDEFGPGGGFVRSFGDLGEPEGIAVGPDRDVYVADQAAGEIRVYSGEGALLRSFGDLGEGAGEMTEPSGLAFDPASGDLFVADKGLARVDVFTPEGEFVRAFGKEVNVEDDSDVCAAETGCQRGLQGSQAGRVSEIRGIAFGLDNGDVYLADSSNQRIDVFTPKGEFLAAFGEEVRPGGGDLCNGESGCQAGDESESAGSVSDPGWAAFDAEGNLEVSSGANSRIDVFTPAGSFVRAYGQGVVDGRAEFQICTASCQAGTIDSTPGSGSLLTPEGLAIDCGGSLEVLEVEDSLPLEDRFARIERFGEAGAPTPPCTPPVEVVRRLTAISAPLVLALNRFKFGRLKLNRKDGTAILFVKVPGRGRLLLRGEGVRPARRHAHRAGAVKLPVVPIGHAKRHLRRHHRVKLKVKVTFTPTGGRPFTRAKRIHLKKGHH